MILKELIFDSFYFGRGIVVLKEVIFNNLYFGQGVVVLKNVFVAVSTLAGCGGLEGTDF